tara:strand:- start:1516 stop:2520 length:1005 start_codon:yes stop_codon:yes gene_type:complete
MEKGGIMDSRRDKDKEFDRAQEREYMRSQYDSLTQDDKEKLKMIQQMMAKEKVNYAKGGLLRVLKDSGFNHHKGSPKNELKHNRGQYIATIGKDNMGEVVHLDKYTPNTKRYISSTSFDNPKKLADYFNKNQLYAKGGEVKKSEKYGSEYKKEDGQLLFRPINTKEDWSEVSDEAFNKEERKDFDKEMERLFGKKVDFGRGGDIEEVYLVQVEWKQLKDKGLGKFILTESDVERLEDDYGSTFYFEIYDDSDEKPISFTKMKNILDKAMAEKGLTESYFEKGGKTIDFKLDYLYNQLKISKNILDNSINNAEKTINLIRYDAIQKAIDNILIKP